MYFPLLLICRWFVATVLVEAILPWFLYIAGNWFTNHFLWRPFEIRQRKRESIVYDSWAAASETWSLFGCAGQQSDNGWRGLLEPAVPLGFVNAVRGGWRGSSAFISTFRDAHSCSPCGFALSLSSFLSLLSYLLQTVYLCDFFLVYRSLSLSLFLFSVILERLWVDPFCVAALD